jgi:hypothetical protein
VRRRRGRGGHRGPNGPRWRGLLPGRRHLVLFASGGPLVAHFSSFCSSQIFQDVLPDLALFWVT